MVKAIVTATACAVLLCTGPALATVTPQQNCDNARIRAWTLYKSCVEWAVASNAKSGTYFGPAALAKCRHRYFQRWTAFQSQASFASSTCIGSRFTDNGDQTVTDHLSGLLWEKKANLDGTVNLSDPHDADNLYTWSTGSNNENGTAYTNFLGTLNGGGGFAGATGWRLPTLAELQTIVLDFSCTKTAGSPTCSCSASPCIDATLDVANTSPGSYWSATSYLPDPSLAWYVGFSDGLVVDSHPGKTSGYYVRAVRGGL